MKERKNGVEVLNNQSDNTSQDSTNKRIDKLEATVFRMFGFLLGMFLVHLLSHIIERF